MNVFIPYFSEVKFTNLFGLFLSVLSLFITNPSYSQWTKDYPVEMYSSGYYRVHWLDSQTYLYSNTLFHNYGEVVSNNPIYGIPLSLNRYLTSDENYYYLRDSMYNIIGQSAFTTAQDTGVKQVIQSVLFDVNPSCIIHIIERLDRTVSARISFNQGGSWSDSEYIGLDTKNGISYPFHDKFNAQSVGNMVWIYSGLEPTKLFRSSDLGRTWETITLPSWLKPAAYNSIAFSTEKFGLMTCFNDGKLARTTDGGETWEVDGFQKPSGLSNRITFANATTNNPGFFMIYGIEGCYYSYSNGQWWHKIDGEKHNLVSFYNANFGVSFYEAPNNNLRTNYRTFSNMLSTGIDLNLDDRKPEFYPNPSNGLLFTQSETDLAGYIYNSQGITVYRFTQFSAAQPLNLSSLPSGIYFLKSEDGTLVQKVILD